MGLVASLFRANNPALDDRFWNHVGIESSAGIRVSPESARRATAVYACVHIRAETIASLPLIIYRRLANGDKERAPEHPAYKVLHDRPNNWQTAFEWREMMQSHLDFRGNAYSRILSGPSGPIDQLIPLHPDRVKPVLYTDGSIDYTVSTLDGKTEKLFPDEILHLRGWSENGFIGLSPISAQRDTIGIALASQDYTSRFLRNDVSPSLVYRHPTVLDPASYERLKNDIHAQGTGENRHRAMLLEEGMTVEKIGMSNRDAQIIENDKLTDARIAAIYRVPPHMINMMDRATHSNIEHQGIEFTVYTVLPIAKRWEGIIARDLFYPLLGDSGEYFAEFLLDGLNRGDLASRYTAYSIGRNWGWLSANDVRRLENMNSIGPEGDEYLRPLNMTVEGDPQPKQLTKGGNPPPDDSPSEDATDDEEQQSAAAQRTQLFAIAQSAACRMARKESAAIRKIVSKHRQLPDAAAFCAEVREFYAGHVKLISGSLCIPEAMALNFCLLNRGPIESAAAAGNWALVDSTILMNEGRARNLAQLAMEVIQ